MVVRNHERLWKKHDEKLYHIIIFRCEVQTELHFQGLDNTCQNPWFTLSQLKLKHAATISINPQAAEELMKFKLVITKMERKHIMTAPS